MDELGALAGMLTNGEGYKLASGKKNYFRHSFFARNDLKLKMLRDKVGVGFYFYYFSLLEQCGEASSDELKDKYVFHDSTIRNLWCINLKKSERVANEMNAVGLLFFKKAENTFQFTIPNLAKYLGKYDSKSISNAPNKRKEKEKKEKEKKHSDSPSNVTVGFFEKEPGQTLEEVSVSDLARNVLTALNSICFTAHRPNKLNMGHINARIQEKYAYEDFVAVIKHKHKQWSNDPKMSEYLRPRTLFCTNFDGYLQAAKNADKPNVDPLEAWFKEQGHEPERMSS